jgi:hypothetical protein
VTAPPSGGSVSNGMLGTPGEQGIALGRCSPKLKWERIRGRPEQKSKAAFQPHLQFFFAGKSCWCFFCLFKEVFNGGGADSGTKLQNCAPLQNHQQTCPHLILLTYTSVAAVFSAGIHLGGYSRHMAISICLRFLSREEAVRVLLNASAKEQVFAMNAAGLSPLRPGSSGPRVILAIESALIASGQESFIANAFLFIFSFFFFF